MTSKAEYPLKRAFIDIGIFSFGVNTLMLVMPLYMLQVYDRVLTSSSTDTLVFLSIIAGFALVVLGALEAVRSVYGARIANRLDMAYSRQAMLNGMNAAGGSDAMRNVRDLAQVRNFLNSRLAFVVFDMPFAPLFVGILWFVHPVLFWITFSGIVALVLLALANQWASARAAKEAKFADTQNQLNGQSLLNNAESLRALGMTTNALRMWENGQLNQLSSNDSRARVSSFMTGLSRTIRLGLQISILGVGAYLVLNREMTAGMIFAASIISSKGLQPVDQVIGSWRQIFDSWEAWKSLKSSIDLKKPDIEYTKFEKPAGKLSAENLIYYPFKMQGAKPVLQGIGFSLPAGASLGILGASGAGKSTLLRLLAGAVKADGGTIRIDNNDIKNWDPDQLGRHVGYVEQRVELLPGTIAQNIARFDENVSDEAIIAAASAANVEAMIEKLPESYQTLIGPGARKLSGGEMQQVGLARAFYGDPQIMLLDEPNASLDPEARERLKTAIEGARKAKKTIVVITQRDEMLAHVDALLALKDGKRIDFGPRDEVLERLFGVKKAANDEKPKPQKTATTAAQTVSPFEGLGPGMRPIKVAASKGDK